MVRLGLPTLLEKSGEGAGLLHEGDRARDRVLGAVDPGIVMIAAHHPLVGMGGAGDFYDDVVERLDVPVGLHFEVDFRRPWSHVISLGQGTAPGVGDHFSLERGQQRLRVGVGNGQAREFW